MRASVIGSLAAGAAGTALLATAEPLAVAALGAALIGLAAGDSVRAGLHRVRHASVRTLLLRRSGWSTALRASS